MQAPPPNIPFSEFEMIGLHCYTKQTYFLLILNGIPITETLKREVFFREIKLSWNC